MNPTVPEGPPVSSASEFFSLCERVVRRTYDPDDIDRPVMAFFDAEGHMRLRPVASEEAAATLGEGAWQYPAIAAVGLLRERDGAIVATYRTRAGEEWELRIAIVGSGGTRTLGKATRVQVNAAAAPVQ